MSQAPGWYRDPFFRGQERYWDGRMWTQGIRPPEDEAKAEAEVRPVTDAPLGDVSGPTVGASPAAAATPGPEPTFAPLGAPAAPPMPAPVPLTAVYGPPAPGASSDARKQRRLAVVGVAAAALLLVAGGVTAAFVLGQPNNASASEAVSTAATQSMNAKSADVTMSMHMSVAGMDETLSGNGAFNFVDKTGTLTMNIGAAGQQFTEQAIYDGTMAYVNLGSLLGNLTQGKPWISMDLSKLEAASGAAGGIGSYGDPAGALRQLESIGSTVTSLGPTTYEGTSVTEYSVSIPPSVMEKMLGQLPSSVKQYLGQLPNLKEDVYIEGDNLLRAIDMPMSFSVEGKQVSVDVTQSFSNYGTPVNVTPPPADQVIPISQVGGGVGGAFGGLFGDGNSGSTGTTGTTGNTGTI